MYIHSCFYSSLLVYSTLIFPSSAGSSRSSLRRVICTRLIYKCDFLRLILRLYTLAAEVDTTTCDSVIFFVVRVVKRSWQLSIIVRFCKYYDV